MASLTRDQILEADDLKTETVDVPEWGGSVLIRTMTGADRDALGASMVTVLPDGTRQQKLENHKSKLLAMTIVGEDGNLLFSIDDVDRLARKSDTALNRVFEASQRLNGIGVEAVEEAAKNSEAAQSGDSPSA
jgi:hypothetical protein